MEVFLSPKIPKKYNCESCHYHTSNKKDFDKHLLTAKHKNIANGSILEIMEVKKLQNNICECGKYFMTSGGLWKHKKKCNHVKWNLINLI